MHFDAVIIYTVTHNSKLWNIRLTFWQASFLFYNQWRGSRLMNTLNNEILIKTCMSHNTLHICQSLKEVAECACLKIRYESHLSVRKQSPWSISWQPQLRNWVSLFIVNFRLCLLDCGILGYHCLQFKKDHKPVLTCLS